MSKPPKRPHSKASVKKIVNTPKVKRWVAQSRLQAQADAQLARKRPASRISPASQRKAVAKVKKAQQSSRTQTAAMRYVNSGRRR